MCGSSKHCRALSDGPGLPHLLSGTIGHHLGQEGSLSSAGAAKMKVNLGMNVNGLHVLIMLKSKDTWKFACCHEQNEQVIGF